VVLFPKFNADVQTLSGDHSFSRIRYAWHGCVH